MFNFVKYSSIDNLNRKTFLLENECVVTEKLHGTNTRWAVSSEQGLIIGSRNQIVYQECDSNIHENTHYGFVSWLLKQKELLQNVKQKYINYVFYGEWIGSGIQKGIQYSADKQFYVFDIKSPEGDYLDWPEVVKACRELSLNIVPEVMSGYITIEQLNTIIDQISIVGKQNGFVNDENIQEGFVIKTIHTKYDNKGNRLIAKYKSEKWAEKASAPKVRNINPEQMNVLQDAKQFAESCVTDGRVSTIIDHITRDSDNKTLDMSKTGEFLREMVKDISESESNFYNTLDKENRNVYNKAINNIALLKWKKYLAGF